MQLEKQVINLEQAKRLKELGVVHKSLFYWEQTMFRIGHEYDISSGDWRIGPITRKPDEPYLPAFTVAELGVALPEEINHKENSWSSYDFYYGYSTLPEEGIKKSCWYQDDDLNERECILHFAYAETEAEARASMLIYLLEKNIIPVSEVNERLKNA